MDTEDKDFLQQFEKYFNVPVKNQLFAIKYIGYFNESECFGSERSSNNDYYTRESYHQIYSRLKDIYFKIYDKNKGNYIKD